MDAPDGSLSRTLRMHTSERTLRVADTDGARARLHLTPESDPLPAGVTLEMAGWFIVSAEQTGKKLVAEAQRDRTQSHALFLAREHGVQVFQHAPPSAGAATKADEPAVSRARSLWNRVIHPRRSSAAAAARQKPAEPSPEAGAHPRTKKPRVFGLAHVDAPFHELAEMLSFRGAASASLLHPHATETPLVHTLMDLTNEHACLRHLVVPAAGLGTVRGPRDFVVVDYEHAFRLPNGRNCLVVSFHSVNWAGCPESAAGVVRGSVYTSGVVAIESETHEGRVDLFGVAELNLKGDASEQQHVDASCQRVLQSLGRIKTAIEARGGRSRRLEGAHTATSGRASISRLPYYSTHDTE